MAQINKKHSEDELGQKWDRCVTDGILKAGGGLALGLLSSLLLFKAKRWPIIFGGGIGVGLAYRNCEQEINASLTKT
ncbi:MICOS complex subunit Mic10-like [Homalodisca vitripennis]|uniref:MICOS complex subunit Mic10-like n=1 Tax=Homalodisca vitripennis TaxID=197043 RepID=UPI001EEC1747|nr:MICOS complex subunit Mic10-like [Homalodisca vitripennis]